MNSPNSETDKTPPLTRNMALPSFSESTMLDLENQLQPKRAEEETASITKNTNRYQYEEVMRELEHVKDELGKLKLEMASVLEEKMQAGKKIEASSSKTMSHSCSVGSLKNEIEEVIEERTLKELYLTEAMKDLEGVEAQRKEEFNRFSIALENTRRKMKQTLEEIDCVKQMKADLSVTSDDISVLQMGLDMSKESEKHVQRIASLRSFGSSFHGREESGSPSLLKSVAGELETAKKELESVQREAVQFMDSMDIIRNKLVCVSEETVKLKKMETRTENRIQNLNSKLLRANKKLETVSAAEQKVRAIVSSLTLDLMQLKTETKASEKEKELIRDEITRIQALIQKTNSEIELGEGKLADAMQELESVKASEVTALENLKALVEGATRARTSTPRQSSRIVISKFEHEYLIGRAIGADEIADKKVAAAHAWIEALKASEKEILMKTEIVKRQNREIKAGEKQGKGMYEMERALSQKPPTQSSDWTAARKTRLRKSMSLARASSTVRRKRIGSTSSVKLYDSQSVESDI